MTLLLSNEEIDSMLDVSMVLDAVEQSQLAMASGQALSGPRVDTLAPTTHGEAPATYGLKAMSGLWPEAGVAALRINSDVLVWPTVAGNVRRDRLPTNSGRWTGMIVLYSMRTGEPLMISPDGYISRLRVGATNGLAARYLARKDSRQMALLGTGQLSLTKVLVLVGAERDPRDFRAVLLDIGRRFDPENHMWLLPVAPLDTLDFTSFTMHVGSKLVLDASGPARSPRPARRRSAPAAGRCGSGRG